MDNNKICWPRVLKNCAYVVAPIIVAILIFVIVCLSYPIEREAINKRESFFDTNTFAENYATEIISGFSTVKNFQISNYSLIDFDYYVTEEQVEGNDQVEKIYYFSGYDENNVKWLIIDKQTKEAFTNFEYSLGSSTIEEIQEQINSKGMYWNYNDSKVDTSINKLRNVNYVDSRLEENSEDADNYTIYTSLLDPLEYPDQIYQARLLYNILFFPFLNILLYPFYLFCSKQ